MNSDSNSDSEQCIESKLSRVYSVHTLTQPACTLRTHYAQATLIVPAGCCVVAHRAPCRRPCPTVSLRARARWGAVSQPSPVMIQNCIARQKPCRARCHRITAPRIVSWRTAAPYRSMYLCPYCDTKAASNHNTNICIATPPLARPRALVLPHALARGPVVSWLCCAWPHAPIVLWHP